MPLGAYPAAEPWDILTTAAAEMKSLGFYVSGHPLRRYGSSLRTFGIRSVESLARCRDRTLVRLAGQPEQISVKTFHSGDRGLSFHIEDGTGRHAVRMYAKDVDDELFLLSRGLPVLVTGMFRAPITVNDDGEEVNEPKPVRMQNLSLLIERLREEADELVLRIPVKKIADKTISALLRDIRSFPGKARVLIKVVLDGGNEVPIPTSLRVDLSDELFARIERTFGQVAELRASIE